MSEETTLARAEAERELVRNSAKHVRQAANELAQALVLMCAAESDGVAVEKSWRERMPDLYTKGRKAFDLLMEYIEQVEIADQDALVMVVQTAERDPELSS